ncbi:DNA-directed RNA polymerase II subunit RPB1-like isoform X1 [Tachysurus vachellii]|nr:DNA-directed RNA polymerase II subunit RPB1-like isoform X1 [Tachysurus vachellii]
MEGLWILLLAVHIIYYCAAFTTTKTYYEELMYGQTLSIRLPDDAVSLEFISVDESRTDVLWSKASITKRGTVSGSNSDKRFVIHSVTYDDQGKYTLINYWHQKTSIHLLMVVAKRSIQNCVAGESLNIYLGGLPTVDATLRFSNQDLNLTLVERGSAVGNFHPDYMGRIKVTSSNIQLLNVNVSDVGSYTLSDRLNRKIKIISMNLVDHHEGVSAGPLMSLLILLGIPPCIFCYCRKKTCRKNNQPTTTINTTTATVKYDNQINPPGPPPGYANPAAPTAGYTPGYTPVGESTVHPPPNPTFPPQQPYSGYPATSPAMPPNPGHTPGYPPVGEGTVYPPPNPAFPPQPPYSGYPATSPAMPINPPYNPVYPAASGFPPAQPPQWGGPPCNQPVPAGLAPVMYNAPAGSEPVKGEIPPSTPLLAPPQPEVPQPPAPGTGTNVLTSSGSAVQFNVSMGKDSSSNFL